MDSPRKAELIELDGLTETLKESACANVFLYCPYSDCSEGKLWRRGEQRNRNESGSVPRLFAWSKHAFFRNSPSWNYQGAPRPLKRLRWSLTPTRDPLLIYMLNKTMDGRSQKVSCRRFRIERGLPSFWTIGRQRVKEKECSLCRLCAAEPTRIGYLFILLASTIKVRTVSVDRWLLSILQVDHLKATSTLPGALASRRK